MAAAAAYFLRRYSDDSISLYKIPVPCAKKMAGQLSNVIKIRESRLLERGLDFFC